MRGGAFDLQPAPYGSNALGGLDLPQGQQFMQMHPGQHGGANNKNKSNTMGWAPTIQAGGAAPLNTVGVPFLNGQEAVAARTAALDAQLAQTANLKDPGQAGGRRRRRGRKGKKTHRRSRKMRGGALVLTPAEVAWKEAIAVPQGVNPQFASWDAAA